jgi:hypothetical protein
MKKLMMVFLVCLLVFSTTSCYISNQKQQTQKAKSNLSNFTSFDFLPDKANEDNILITTSTSKEYFKKGNDMPSYNEVSRIYHLFNLKTKKTSPFLAEFPGILKFSLEDTDRFDWENFLSDYMPEGENYYEIGRFIRTKKQYAPYIANNQTTNAIIIKVFTKQNLVFFYKAKRKTECQDLWVMNLDGSNQRNITNGNYVMVSNCVLLDNDRIYIDSWSEKEQLSFEFIYYPKQNRILRLFQKDKQGSNFVGIYHNQIILRTAYEGSKQEELCLFDFDGNKKRTICEIPENSDVDEILDIDGNRLFFAYRTTNDKNTIIVINLSTSEIKEVFSRNYNNDDIHLNFNQAENLIYFRLGEYKEIKGKPEYIETFHRIDLATTIDDSFVLPDFTNNYIRSDDGNFIFSFNEYGYPSYNTIIDCKTKKITKLNKSLRLGYIYPTYIPSTKQFCFCIDSDDPKEIYFVDLDGKVTKYPLWK